MLRLQQVTMMALHNFLGLTQELINYVSFSVHLQFQYSKLKQFLETLCKFIIAELSIRKL